MKNINYFEAKKYNDTRYEKVVDHIYKTEDTFMGGEHFVTSLCFEQEPQYDEGLSPKDISQYPLEDILDKYYVAVEDFYETENNASSSVCYLEFSGKEFEDITELLEIVGKHVFNEEVEEDGHIYVKLNIEQQ
jgi:hypothetical protein